MRGALLALEPLATELVALFLRHAVHATAIGEAAAAGGIRRFGDVQRPGAGGGATEAAHTDLVAVAGHHWYGNRAVETAGATAARIVSVVVVAT